MKDFILETWEAQAERHGSDHAASWGDRWMIDLEVAQLCAHLPTEGVVLDVGCANGYSTELIRHNMPYLSFRGVDFSPKMIAQAISREGETGSGIHYQVADARSLPFDDESYDAVYTTRTLINLPTWSDQRVAIEELLRVTRPGGQVLIAEAFWEPLVALNALRSIAGLRALEEHDFNRYLKLHRVKGVLDDLGLEYEVVEYSSLYYLGSRFVRELATVASDYPGYTNPINEWFHDLERRWSGGPFSVQSLVSVRV